MPTIFIPVPFDEKKPSTTAIDNIENAPVLLERKQNIDPEHFEIPYLAIINSINNSLKEDDLMVGYSKGKALDIINQQIVRGGVLLVEMEVPVHLIGNRNESKIDPALFVPQNTVLDALNILSVSIMCPEDIEYKNYHNAIRYDITYQFEQFWPAEQNKDKYSLQPTVAKVLPADKLDIQNALLEESKTPAPAKQTSFGLGFFAHKEAKAKEPAPDIDEHLGSGSQSPKQ